MKTILLTALLGAALFAAGMDEGTMHKGKRLFEQTCSGCHGKDGKGVMQGGFNVQPRDLTKSMLTEEQLFLVAKKGAFHWGAVTTGMPAWEGVYDDDSLKAVAHYIYHTFAKESSQKVQAYPYDSSKLSQKALKRGKKIFFRNCAYCHGKEGKGNGVATYNPEKSIFPYDLTKLLLSEKQIFLFAKYGGKHWGSQKDDMPGWGVKYDDETLMGVARYVEEHLKTGR
ncbi:c-type cytochrome [Hydrogenimonas sp.]